MCPQSLYSVDGTCCVLSYCVEQYDNIIVMCVVMWPVSSSLVALVIATRGNNSQ